MTDVKSDAFNLMFLGVALFLSAAIFLIVGHHMGTQRIRLQAVKNGHAKWIVDEVGGITFEWLRETPCKLQAEERKEKK